MKKSILLLVISFLTFSAAAQTSIKPLSIEEINTQIQKHQAVNEEDFEELNSPFIREPNFSDGQAQNNTLKSYLENDQQLDSVITEKWDDVTSQWEAVAKTEYKHSYHDEGYMQERIEYTLDVESKEWLASSKTEYTYDDRGNMTLYLDYNWDANSNQWIYRSKWSYRFDSNGNRELKEVYSWDSTNNEWIGFYITESTYDDAGKLITNWYSNTWNLVSMQWNNQKKNEYEYSAIGDRITSNYFERDTDLSDWVWKKRSEYFYDGNNNLVQIKEYSRSTDTDDWLYSVNTEYTYDNNGNMLIEKKYSWDSINEKWSTTTDVEYSWDSNANLIQYVYYVTNSSGRIISTMSDYSFDSQGRQTYNRYRHWSWDYNLNLNELYYETIYVNVFNSEDQRVIGSTKRWNSGSNEWSGDKSELSYDTNGNTDYLLNYTWDASSDQWVLYDRDTYYYSDQVISSVSEPILIDEVKIYPNPARDFVFFDVDTHSAFVELFDMQGKKVLSQELLESKQIDVSRLKSGIYFYKLVQADKISSGKIIIK